MLPSKIFLQLKLGCLSQIVTKNWVWRWLYFCSNVKTYIIYEELCDLYFHPFSESDNVVSIARQKIKIAYLNGSHQQWLPTLLSLDTFSPSSFFTYQTADMWQPHEDKSLRTDQIVMSQKFIWGQDKRKKKMGLTSKMKEGNESKIPTHLLRDNSCLRILAFPY